MKILRRQFGACAASAVAWLAARDGFALGRTPLGGTVQFRVPFSLASVDPHRLDSPAAALLGSALFDSLYRLDGTGVEPALAEVRPVLEGAETVVRLRRGLRTARGRTLEALDAARSIARCREMGAKAWLEGIPPPRRTSDVELRFSTTEVDRVARALASPLTAIVPPGFSPDSPDGTGAFRLERKGETVVLSRNPQAALGPSYLDALVLRQASDLSASLRAFEEGEDDLGWLGMGLHEKRPGALPFDAGALGLVVWMAGKEAGAWETPGVLQRVADGVDPRRLAYLKLGAAWTHDHEEAWTGPPADLLVREGEAWFVELAKTLATMVSRPGHEITARPLADADFRARRASREFALALDFVRPFDGSPSGTRIALTTADRTELAREVARHPPRFDEPPRAQTRALRLGILGELRAEGGRDPRVSIPSALSSAWDAASLSRRAKP